MPSFPVRLALFCKPIWPDVTQFPLLYVIRRLNRMERIRLLYLLIRLVNVTVFIVYMCARVCVHVCACMLDEFTVTSIVYGV